MLKAELLSILSMKEEEARQKSRISWLRLGDRNTSFFHKKVTQRTNLNSITKLTTSTGTIVGEEAVGHMLWIISIPYFKLLLPWAMIEHCLNLLVDPNLILLPLVSCPLPSPDTQSNNPSSALTLTEHQV